MLQREMGGIDSSQCKLRVSFWSTEKWNRSQQIRTLEKIQLNSSVNGDICIRRKRNLSVLNIPVMKKNDSTASNEGK